MDKETFDMLAHETARFYRLNAVSFSATRKAPWAGWTRLFEGPAADFAQGSRTQGSRTQSPGARVLDVACGNLRFERFLQERFPGLAMQVDALDNCANLASEPPRGVLFRECDVLKALAGGSLADALPASQYQLVASFGFMHHVPGHANRVRLLRELCSRLAPGGFAAFSFWRFMKEPGLAARAEESTARAMRMLGAKGLRAGALEEGDYLLAWQGNHEAFRYCHSFDDGEIDALLRDAGLATCVLDRFEADGRTGDLNAYIVIGG